MESSRHGRKRRQPSAFEILPVKAVQFHEYGGADKLRFEDAPEPVPAAGEALIRVRACAINHVDLDIREGVSRFPLPLPHTLGIEVAGDVAAASYLDDYPRLESGGFQ